MIELTGVVFLVATEVIFTLLEEELGSFFQLCYAMVIRNYYYEHKAHYYESTRD